MFFTFWGTGTNDAERVSALVTRKRLDEAECLVSVSRLLACSKIAWGEDNEEDIGLTRTKLMFTYNSGSGYS